MTCPICTRQTFPYQDGIVTCKKGHHTPVEASTAWVPAAASSRVHPAVFSVAGAGATVAAFVVAHLLGA